MTALLPEPVFTFCCVSAGTCTCTCMNTCVSSTGLPHVTCTCTVYIHVHVGVLYLTMYMFCIFCSKKAAQNNDQDRKPVAQFLEPHSLSIYPLIVGKLPSLSKLPPRTDIHEWLATNCKHPLYSTFDLYMFMYMHVHVHV